MNEFNKMIERINSCTNSDLTINQKFIDEKCKLKREVFSQINEETLTLLFERSIMARVSLPFMLIRRDIETTKINFLWLEVYLY